MAGRSILKAYIIITLCGTGGSVQYEDCANGHIASIGDGYCNDDNNNEGCLYDGGDCCQCTSIDDGSFSSDTGSASFTCVDPSSPCYSPTAVALQSNCTGGASTFIGNGYCNDNNNNEGCLYDGGDCCQCTCTSSHYSCGTYGFNCLDPEAAYLEPYICEKSRHNIPSCRAGIQQDWIVENAAQARKLAEAVRCSGGSFNVTWRGKIMVNKTISVTDGTVIDVTGVNADSVIDGDGETRLFSVMNASLHLSNITVSNGNAIFGGAIAASRSRLSCTKVSFMGNTATEDGGALHLSNGTSVSFIGEASFSNNTASNGGAVCMTGGSNDVLWAGHTSFFFNFAKSKGGVLYLYSSSSAHWTAKANFHYNSAGSSGGALYLRDSSGADWTAEAHFLNNSAGWDGGALYLYSSSANWSGEAHFLNNSAVSRGGALYLYSSSSAHWTEEAHFLNNNAEDDGGALYLYSSSANWSAEAHFLNNSAGWDGGALCLYSSSANWSAEAHFLYNSAVSSGGALYLSSSSSAHWTEEAHFLYNNAGWDGGALYLYRSSAHWIAEANLLNNSAGWDGGALYMYRSSAHWTAGAQFLNNSAVSRGGALFLTTISSAHWTAEAHFVTNSAGSIGGALYLYSSSAHWIAGAQFLNNGAGSSGGALCLYSSSAHWIAESHFHNNNAGLFGGALYLSSSSNADWTAEAHLLSNSAGGSGGALYLAFSSSAQWTAEAPFRSNSAGDDGGALYMMYGSNASWEGAKNYPGNGSTGGKSGALDVSDIIEFSGNTALSNGGAVYAGDSSYLSWSANILLINNNAKNGGALFFSNSVNIHWSGETDFTSNYARLNGGAIAILSADKERSSVAINAATSFVNNKCGGSGGAMSLVNSASITFNSKEIVFLKNSAGGSGGAVYTAFNGIGIAFIEVVFVENVAQIGGAVHSAGSGTKVTVDKVNPMTFNRCKFVGNHAFATGGAIDSASGQDVFFSTTFEGNKARMGGALRLAGIASIDNCSFEENVSELGGGPAVSNNGYISNVANSYFNHNVFKCGAQKFLHFIELDNPYETVCDGCPPKCFECSFGEGQGSPTCMTLSEAGMEHATSKGGYTTIEELVIHKGYWRATNTSTNILRCFNTKACKGGLTGASDYCAEGYEGPYCSVCSKNYVSSLRFTCEECFDRKIVVVTAAVLLGLALGVVIAIVSYLVSAEVSDARRGIIDYMVQRIPLQSLKIMIILWQILTQFTYVANVKFPSVYQAFLDSVNFFNFDLSWVLSAWCLLEVDFHDRLLWTTILPLVIMGLLGITYAIAMHRTLTSPETTIRHIQHKHVSMALLVTILVYSSVSSVVFQMFACDDLDDGKRYLRADYTIDCDSSKHRVLQIYSGVMILLYPVGIPALYASLLFWNSTSSAGSLTPKGTLLMRSISSLWKPYKPQRYYYEVIECARRISLTGVIVFIYPNSAAQVAVTFAIAVVFIFVSEGMSPYASPWDAWMSRMGQAIIFATMYLALLLKVNVSGENKASQNMFEMILVACHGCMILAGIVQIVIMALSLRVVRQRADPRPRLRRPVNLALAVHPCVIEEDDTSKDEL